MIKINNLCFSYNKKNDVLNNISFGKFLLSGFFNL